MQGGSTLKQRLKGVRSIFAPNLFRSPGRSAINLVALLHDFSFVSLSLYPLSVLGHCHFLFPYRALRTMFAEYFNFTITNHQSKKKVITSRCIVIYNRQILFYTMIQKNVMKSLLLTVKLQTIVVFFCKDCFFVGESRWSVLTSLPFPILGILR